eukprot:CAMPEP_0178425838 /NCGR_PEP_ID=MMETSP0689_2-20121128/28926_1 /TAXON_ID=160604 /ORGANISM="Amphidinium massartii, Strain CS-259" /LENGTH=263 /DNA_ID=CAMNT_0020047507 /DNA_START=218 /DNA_END=1011 /DNA_ORIENTATION=-
MCCTTSAASASTIVAASGLESTTPCPQLWKQVLDSRSSMQSVDAVLLVQSEYGCHSAVLVLVLPLSWPVLHAESAPPRNAFTSSSSSSGRPVQDAGPACTIMLRWFAASGGKFVRGSGSLNSVNSEFHAACSLESCLSWYMVAAAFSAPRQSDQRPASKAGAMSSCLTCTAMSRMTVLHLMLDDASNEHLRNYMFLDNETSPAMEHLPQLGISPLPNLQLQPQAESSNVDVLQDMALCPARFHSGMATGKGTPCKIACQILLL